MEKVCIQVAKHEWIIYILYVEPVKEIQASRSELSYTRIDHAHKRGPAAAPIV